MSQLTITLLPVDLALFDGAAGGGEGGPASGDGDSHGKAAPVVYGKQDQARTDAAEQGENAVQAEKPGGGERVGTDTTSDALEERRRAFRDLISGEYKDLYDQEVQQLTRRAQRDAQALERRAAAVQPVLDMLMQRYQIADGDPGKLLSAIEDDDSYWSQAAEDAGMSVEQYKQFQRLQRENDALVRAQRQQQGQEAARRQLRQWFGEAEEMKRLYPSFSLENEARDPQFLSMLRAGVPVRHAYEVIHMDAIKAGVAQMTAQATEKQVVDGIRARGSRPQENGTAAQSGFVVKDDVSRLTKKDRAEIARRAQRGEHITF